MKILWICAYHAPAYTFGGPVTTGVALCKGFVQAGHSVTVLTTDLSPRGRSQVVLGKPMNIDGTRVVYVRGYRRVPLPFFAPALFGVAKKLISGVDCVLTSACMTYPQIVAAVLARRQGVPFFPVPHNTFSASAWSTRGPAARLYYRLVERPIINMSSGVVYSSQGERRESAFHRFTSPQMVCPLCIDPERLPAPNPSSNFRVRYGIPDESQIILFVGRLTPWKGVDDLIRALRIIRIRVPDVVLAVVGPDAGYRKQLVALAQKEHVDESVCFTGELFGQDLRDAYAHADLFGFLSRFENFGAVVGEAMVFGVPAVIADSLGDADRFRLSGGVRMVSRNPETFAEVATEILKNESLRREMSRKAREFAALRLSPTVCAAEFVAQILPIALQVGIHGRG